MVHTTAKPGHQACHQCGALRRTLSCYCCNILPTAAGWLQTLTTLHKPSCQLHLRQQPETLTANHPQPPFHLTHGAACSGLTLAPICAAAEHGLVSRPPPGGAARVVQWQPPAGRHLLMRRVSHSGKVQRQTGQLVCSFSHVWMQPLQNLQQQGDTAWHSRQSGRVSCFATPQAGPAGSTSQQPEASHIHTHRHTLVLACCLDPFPAVHSLMATGQ